MENVLGTLGWIMILLLAAVGLLAGWIASRIAGGRNTPLYLLVGVVAAVAAPFVLAALGLTALVGTAVIAVLLVALVFAIVVLVVVRAIIR
ncbi:hypothetical protein ruthe_01137 [Rubellimicrobium thermophilum DSM 16684]|uniref:Transglycosylase associated protein n=1 Tax=Rubellimicrobium thermophilum DSM 16684 TaxID=1123069 RepID=S9R2W6_9RHOB|nr:hypothetical protein [Rubellimicrobium thermophilum]EPX86323.1 hypothetical protein ruthe_01137 [Rubellimicrobium thermophilum DSM 16684]